MISPSSLDFLKKLAKNNNKTWFENNRDDYNKVKVNMKAFMQFVCDKLNEHDVIEKHTNYRIFRDVRFSKIKTPYKTHLGGYFRRFGKSRRGGYTLSIEPGGQSRVGGGFYAPNKDDLLRIRKEFELDPKEINRILADPNFVKNFGELLGEGVKTAPRGFSKEHSNIALIRKKQFYAFRNFTDEEVCSPDFVSKVNETFLAIRPYFDYMTEVLTTNLNGESII